MRGTIGLPCKIWGWAWSDRGIARVEVSTDGGRHWGEAALEQRSGWNWQRYEYAWRPQTAGAIELSARAFDFDGTSQPDDGARNAIHRVAVRVGQHTSPADIEG